MFGIPGAAQFADPLLCPLATLVRPKTGKVEVWRGGLGAA
jgi:hypothetical protein